ncbi:MAG: LPS export ABC transporter periplasmic protein LptC [Bacteroidales bacterium]|jgi:LPS export ABC transporter protein LptC|nr:LPS export ABC transporter periplasmic protein LptC [Bacteroidales bacterium]
MKRTPNGNYALRITHYALITALVAISSCTTKMQSLDNYNIDETFADMSTKDLHTKYYSQHRLQTTIDAPVLDQFSSVKQPYWEFPKGVKVVFYDEQLKAQSSLTSGYAVYYTKKKLWEARNNVEIVNESGTKLNTEQIFGDENGKKVFSVKKVTVTDPDGTVIVGKQGFESDMAFKNYKFLDVNGVVSLQEQYDEMNKDE